jgi:hypothetical protein
VETRAPILEFGCLQIEADKVQVDKQVLHHVEVAARKNPLLEKIRSNVFRAKDLKNL